MKKILFLVVAIIIATSSSIEHFNSKKTIGEIEYSISSIEKPFFGRGLKT
jgi:hypothetical protein